MRKFRVFVRGENFSIKADSSIKRFGFYTTRFVEAINQSEAEGIAIESIRQDEQLRGMVLNDPSDPPRLFAEEVAEISSLEMAKKPGLTWFEDQLAAH